MTKKRFTHDHLGIIKDNHRHGINTLTVKEIVDLLNQYDKENKELRKQNNQQKQELLRQDITIIDIKNTIKNLMENERTHMGYNALRQAYEAIQ